LEGGSEDFFGVGLLFLAADGACTMDADVTEVGVNEAAVALVAVVVVVTVPFVVGVGV